MAVIFEDDFRSYASKDDLPRQYDVYSPTASAVVLEANGSRQVLRLVGNHLAKSISPEMRDVSFHAIFAMTTETTNTTTHLFRIGINPPGAPAAAQAVGGSSGYMFVDFSKTLCRVGRGAYLPDGTMTGNRTTMTSATLPTTIMPGNICRVEIRVQETSETCHITVLLNGVVLIDTDYTRTISGNPCNLGIGSFTVFASNPGTSSLKALLGDLIVYKADTDVPFPLGNITMVSLDSGVTSEIITDTADYDLPDATISGTIASVAIYGRMDSVGITSRNGSVAAVVNGAVAGSSGRQVVSGMLTPDIRHGVGKLTNAQINGMKIRIGVS